MPHVKCAYSKLDATSCLQHLICHYLLRVKEKNEYFSSKTKDNALVVTFVSYQVY